SWELPGLVGARETDAPRAQLDKMIPSSSPNLQAGAIQRWRGSLASSAKWLIVFTNPRYAERSTRSASAAPAYFEAAALSFFFFCFSLVESFGLLFFLGFSAPLGMSRLLRRRA